MSRVHSERKCSHPKEERYVCAGCARRVCWCNGASDDMPEHCDFCWGRAHAKKRSPRYASPPSAAKMTVVVGAPGAVVDEEDLDTMRHATAWPKCYRNHYCANAEGPEAKRWAALVEIGFAEEGARINGGTSRVFRVTDLGRAALDASGPRRKPTILFVGGAEAGGAK